MYFYVKDGEMCVCTACKSKPPVCVCKSEASNTSTLKFVAGVFHAFSTVCTE